MGLARAPRPDGTLPTAQADTAGWIWNEGNPADIPLFNGTRACSSSGRHHTSERGTRAAFFPEWRANLRLSRTWKRKRSSTGSLASRLLQNPSDGPNNGTVRLATLTCSAS